MNKISKQLFEIEESINKLENYVFNNKKNRNAKVILARQSDTIKKKILTCFPEIANIASEHNLHIDNCAIHHMEGKTNKKYVSVDGFDDQTYNKILCAIQFGSEDEDQKKIAIQQIKQKKYNLQDIQKISNEIKNQVDTCVLVPITIHNWLNGNLQNKKVIINGRQFLLRNREEYYIFINAIRADKKKLKKMSHDNKTNNSLIDAIKSLCRLNSLISTDINSNSSDITKKIKAICATLENKIKKENKALSIEQQMKNEIEF